MEHRFKLIQKFFHATWYASLVARMVKNLPTVQETWVWSLGLEDPLEKGKATHSSILAWRIPGTVYSIGVTNSQTRLNDFHCHGQFSSVAQSCLTVCNPMDCSMPIFPVHHQLPELTQTHVHRVSDGIQPSHPLHSPSPPAFNLSQHQGLFK